MVVYARMGQTVVVPYFMTDGGANGYPFFNNGRVNSLSESIGPATILRMHFRDLMQAPIT